MSTVELSLLAAVVSRFETNCPTKSHPELTRFSFIMCISVFLFVVYFGYCALNCTVLFLYLSLWLISTLLMIELLLLVLVLLLLLLLVLICTAICGRVFDVYCD